MGHLRMKKLWAFAALATCVVVAEPVWAKRTTAVDRAENRETFVSVGDTLVKITMRESLPNAFGGSDIFGRKRDRGFVEVRYMGLAADGRAVFRRRTVDVYTNETTMTRMQPRWGSATVTAHGNRADISSFSVGSDQAHVEALPPDTIEFALDLSKNKTITVEDRIIEVVEADGGGVKFVLRSR